MVKLNNDFLEILKKGGAALFLRIFGFLAGYFFVYLTVRYFGAETQGRISLSFSIMIVSSLVCRLGADVNFVKIFAINNNIENAKGLYFKSWPLFFLMAASLGVVLYFGAGFISSWAFNDPKLELYLKWTAPSIVFFTLLLINASVFRGLRKNALYAFLFNGGRFVFTLVFFLLLIFLWDKDPISTIIAHTLALGTLFLISVFYIRKYMFPKTKETTYSVKPFILDSLPMFLSASMIVLLGWTDTIILGIYEESSVVGMYSVVLKIATVVSFSLQAVDSILAPKLSRAFHDKDMRLFKSLIKFSTIINAVIAIGAVLFIFIFQDFILNIFGAEFQQAATAMLILCVGQLFNAVIGPVGSMFQMTGYQKVFQNILIVSFIINLALNLLLIKDYGINGVAVATAVSLIVSKLVSAYYVKKLIWNME
ncbi:MAG: polysaccharide biosynthesis C-terminal domain-containing protein [Bacteroidetes bacterium]|nr:polysaccharide biosynthesis C-terminal domain-containing protein [Bacteroidota bacterium]